MVVEAYQTLNDLRVSQKARITALQGQDDLRQRLGEMGLTPGSEIQLLRTAPLGDPLEVALRGYRLSLRRSQARNVIIEPIPSQSPEPPSTTKRWAVWGKRAGVASFLFFSLKGLFWLGLGAVVFFNRGCGNS